MSAASLMILSALLSAQGAGRSGSVVLFEFDIRSVAGNRLVQEATVFYREDDCFLALVEDPLDPGLPPHEVLEPGRLSLEELRIGRLPPGRTVPGSLPGKIVFRSGANFIIRMSGEAEDPLFVPGIGFLGRLHPYPVAVQPAFQEAPPGFDGFVSDMVGAVSGDSLQACIQLLEDYETRYMFSPQYDACADRIDTWMEDHGLPCELQTFEYGGDSMANVVAELAGIEEPEIVYVVCAHLDSYCETNPMVSAPGADDDASGCAGVMEAARIMGQYSFRHTVRFVCFAAEEAWMVGSHYYVEQAAAAGDDIRGAVNLDMILYAPNPLDTLYIAFDDQSALLGQLAGIVASGYVPQLPAFVDYNPGEAGDHCSFWEFGYSAVVGAEASADEIWGGYNPWYHQPGDLLANYMPSFPYGTDAVRIAVALAATLAEPVGPSSAEGGTVLAAALSIWPNPSFGLVTVAPQGLGVPSGLQVIDLSGRIAWSGTVFTEPLDIDLRFLPAGVYLVRCGDPGVESARLVIL